MLSTGYALFAILFALFFVAVGVGAVISARKSANYARRVFDLARENTIEAVSTSKLAEIERTVTELSDSHDALVASHKRLRSKYGMRDLRERRNNGHDDGDTPDLFQDDDKKAAYKAALRNKCRAQGLLR